MISDVFEKNKFAGTRLNLFLSSFLPICVRIYDIYSSYDIHVHVRDIHALNNCHIRVFILQVIVKHVLCFTMFQLKVISHSAISFFLTRVGARVLFACKVTVTG